MHVSSGIFQIRPIAVGGEECAEKANSRAPQQVAVFLIVRPVRSELHGRHESLSLRARGRRRVLICKLFYFQLGVCPVRFPYTTGASYTESNGGGKKKPRSVYYALCHTYNILIRALQYYTSTNTQTRADISIFICV